MRLSGAFVVTLARANTEQRPISNVYLLSGKAPALSQEKADMQDDQLGHK